ncbi:MAG: hypothetical protein WCT10_04505 [Patescibacteria group bacterium]|jgi:N-acyl-L-homoserine lactone synthetase
MNEDAMDVLVRWDIADVVNGISTIFTAEAGIPLSAEAKLAMYHLRYLEFAGTMPGKQFPDQIESDRFDAHSYHFVARLGSEVLGSARLIPCEKGFPMEDEREVLLPDGTPWVFPQIHPVTGIPVSRAEAVETSRLIGRPYELPSGDLLWSTPLILEVMKKFTVSIPECKYSVAFLRVRLLDLFRKLGYDWISISPPQEFRGGQFQAAWIDSVQFANVSAGPRILPQNKNTKP